MSFGLVPQHHKLGAVHGLNTMDFYLPRVTWLLLLVSTQSASSREMLWLHIQSQTQEDQLLPVFRPDTVHILSS
jgi:hypothetical protein